MRILIANRGEIARRIIRTAHALGHETVAVYADPDRRAPFVSEATVATHLGPAPLAESYLSIERLVDAAKRCAATAVHPGYGFLAESGAFARAVVEAGMIWIGPRADAIDQMGSKIEARRLAAAAGVPTIPGFDESQDPDALAAAATKIGYPVLVKAAAGGGGKGIRIVEEPGGFAAALAEATAEADRSFGDKAMIVERYILRPRHVEVQVIGDHHGKVIDLGTRECSVQRRYQKLLEEAPAPNLPEATREGLCAAAVKLSSSIGYDSTGTVEFIVDDESGDFFFLEMNTRLQVEHPVTEAVTGFDLVELQIRLADGEPLPISQDEVTLVGHAFEARINAEDPSAGFVPRTGTVTHLRVPEGVRFESGIELGSRIPPDYDPLVAKLVVAGPDRAAARRRLSGALDELILGGLVTNTGFHRWLVEQDPIVDGRVTTRFLDEAGLPPEPDSTLAAKVATRAWVAARAQARPAGPWGELEAFRLTPHHPDHVVILADNDGETHEVDVSPLPEPLGTHLTNMEGGVEHRVPASVDLTARSVAVNVAGHTHTFAVVSRSEHWAPSSADDYGAAAAAVAPFPAVVTEVAVTPGQSVEAGDLVVVIDAMKMLHSLVAHGHGVVDEVRVAAGDSVEGKQVLVTFQAEAKPVPGD